MEIAVKRAYDSYAPEDGYRVLVDRLWPRGISRENLKADLWFKDVAPSNALRKQFHHGEMFWEDFAEAYRQELEKAPEALERLREALKGRRKVTLLYGAKDPEHNQAVILRNILLKH
ncbi:DUF488 family protein [Desulfovibrio sp. OttesenSCG-928-C14]|nr:DUF488 family protein [Desulfovibrio sp. OttesenSCG-928-C14]